VHALDPDLRSKVSDSRSKRFWGGGQYLTLYSLRTRANGARVYKIAGRMSNVGANSLHLGLFFLHTFSVISSHCPFDTLRPVDLFGVALSVEIGRDAAAFFYHIGNLTTICWQLRGVRGALRGTGSIPVIVRSLLLDNNKPQCCPQFWQCFLPYFLGHSSLIFSSTNFSYYVKQKKNFVVRSPFDV